MRGHPSPTEIMTNTEDQPSPEMAVQTPIISQYVTLSVQQELVLPNVPRIPETCGYNYQKGPQRPPTERVNPSHGTTFCFSPQSFVHITSHPPSTHVDLPRRGTYHFWSLSKPFRCDLDNPPGNGTGRCPGDVVSGRTVHW